MTINMVNYINKLLTCLFIFLSSFTGESQEIPSNTEQQLELFAEEQDDSNEQEMDLLQQLEHYRKNPINLNIAEEANLLELGFLNELQVEHFISYRRLLGNLESLYELQAIPGWDISTIKKILPYVTLQQAVPGFTDIMNRFRDGEYTLVIRAGQNLERSEAYNESSGEKAYKGSPLNLQLRFRYMYKDLLQFGIVGDKDAGEGFGRHFQKYGFDFYSIHFFARRIGPIQSVALGDFSVNMGQGLIHWQGMGFKKSSAVILIKQQGPVLRPHRTAGEFYFNRGAGLTIRKGLLDATIFFSTRRLAANANFDAYTNEKLISSFISSGLHRNHFENGKRNAVVQYSAGSRLSGKGQGWQAGINAVIHKYSLPLGKRDAPYNLYALHGKEWFNFSVDYGMTWKNIHFFGEAAMDKQMASAFIVGLMASLDPKIDLSFLQRIISPAYQSVYGSSFTANTAVTNESGWYSGISIRATPACRVDAYADFFYFPWLKYGVDAPSRGADFLVQFTYRPNRALEIYSRFRTISRETNKVGNGSATNLLERTIKKNWRTHLSFQLFPGFTLRSRVELVEVDTFGIKGRGFLGYIDVFYKPLMKPFSFSARAQFFETDDYDTRLYAYENDVLYSYSIPAFYNKGIRFYFNGNYDIGKKISFWLRWSKTIYDGASSLGSGLDEIKGNKRTEINLQLRYIFN
jgi:hypothetical protein